MEQRDIFCEDHQARAACVGKVGTATLPDGAPEDRWDRVLAGYLCENCAAERAQEAEPEPEPEE